MGVPSQVPTGPGHYTNQLRALRELDDFLRPGAEGPGPRVAILRGPPGSGTTTLAYVWVHRHLDAYPGGRFLVRLTGGPDGAERERAALERLLIDAGHDPDTIPASLEGRAAQWRSLTEGKAVALVIDDALTAAQVRALLPGAGPSAVLVTEAGPLVSLRAWATARSVDLTPMEDSAARELLGRLAGDDRLAAEPEATDELVALCEGSTVALCVVGALLADAPGRPIERLCRRLREGRVLEELSAGDDLSVKVVLDVAYERLRPLARRAYQALGVHPGPGDVSAAAVAAATLGIPPGAAAAELEVLERARLVTEAGEATEAGEGRFRAPSLVRGHARAVADALADGPELRRRLLAYYTDRALAAESLTMPDRGWREAIWPGPPPDTAGLTKDDAWAWFEAERENLRSAVDLARDLGDTRRAAQLCVALWPLHMQRRHPHDQVAANAQGVAAAEADGDLVCASLLASQLGYGHRELGDLDRAAAACEASVAFAERSGFDEARASAWEALGLVRLAQGRRADAVDLLRRNLDLAVSLPSATPRRIALARFHLARAEAPEAALPLLDAARATFAGLGSDGLNVVKVDLWRGRALTAAGRPAEAGGVLASAAAAAEERWHVERAQLCEARADVAVALGEPDVARSHLEDAREIYRYLALGAEASAVEGRLAAL